MEILSEENQEKRLSLFKNSTSLPKSIELVLTTEEVNFLHRLLSHKIDKRNSQSAIQVFGQFDQFKQYVSLLYTKIEDSRSFSASLKVLHVVDSILIVKGISLLLGSVQSSWKLLKCISIGQLIEFIIDC